MVHTDLTQKTQLTALRMKSRLSEYLLSYRHSETHNGERYFSGFMNKDVAWFHKSSKTLVVADLIFNLPGTEQVWGIFATCRMRLDLDL
jgi:hypothetical protein